jgi:hypothetical protein
MKKQIVIATLLMIVLSGVLAADTLVLTNGQRIQGDLSNRGWSRDRLAVRARR